MANDISSDWSKPIFQLDCSASQRNSLYNEIRGYQGVLIFRYLHGSPSMVLARAGVLIAIIALVDWRVDLNISFGFLYLFPVILIGTVLSRWQIVLAALFCTLLSDLFDPFAFTLVNALPQDILVFTSLAGTGLFAYEVMRSRRREAENLQRVEAEAAARREAEEQLEFLIDSSPAAILTMTSNGRILLANAAAHRLFGVAGAELPGKSISRYIPAWVVFLRSSRRGSRFAPRCNAVASESMAMSFWRTYSSRHTRRRAVRASRHWW